MIRDNYVQTFRLESSNLRGRVVRIGSIIDDILNAHQYPKPVAHLVAETMTLCLCLSSMLKYEGIFTLQAQGNGPIKMLVSDVTSEGDIRACATFDQDRFQASREQISALKATEDGKNHLAQYLGKGYIAFTVDPKGNEERYQGIVELRGASMIDCVQHYFNQSEQINTGIKMSVGQRDDKWRACAIMLQNMPEEDKGHQGNLEEDDWRRAMILLDSCTQDELLAEDLESDQLLIRLFHEEGIRVFERKTVQKNCRCDIERVKNILRTMSEEDIEYIKKDDKISIKCEFCSTEYIFDPEEFLKNDKK
ncbi:MAG: Hsp33 family molecular chaperone HslO [Alphaproteobacteria bacterium]|nr:Hsp33 family molecular chaperone HslO [Alphaproteobacteria bacterium]